MTKIESLKYEQAAEWFATFQEQELSGSTLEKWEQWIADPDNRRSYASIIGLWSRGEALGPMILPDPQAVAADNYDGSESVATWFERQGVKPLEHIASNAAAEPAQRRIWRQWNRVVGLAAAAAVVAIGILGGIYSEFWWRVTASTERYHTGTGEHRTVTLPDGSMVELGARSTLRVQLTRERRSVFLEQGEVFFDVAKDPKRPFIVQAGGLQLSVLGTAFNVSRAKDQVVVSVKEGTLRVSPSEGPRAVKDVFETDGAAAVNNTTPHVEILTQGQQVRYNVSGLSAVTPINAQYISSWREGHFQYLYAPLHEVIGDINRYSRHSVILDDQARELRFTGTVFHTNVDDFINQLPDIFPLQIETDTGQIVLRLHQANARSHY